MAQLVMNFEATLSNGTANLRGIIYSAKTNSVCVSLFVILVAY